MAAARCPAYRTSCVLYHGWRPLECCSSTFPMRRGGRRVSATSRPLHPPHTHTDSAARRSPRPRRRLLCVRRCRPRLSSRDDSFVRRRANSRVRAVSRLIPCPDPLLSRRAASLFVKGLLHRNGVASLTFASRALGCVPIDARGGRGAIPSKCACPLGRLVKKLASRNQVKDQALAPTPSSACHWHCPVLFFASGWWAVGGRVFFAFAPSQWGRACVRRSLQPKA